MIDIAFKNIRSKKIRSLLCIIGILICVLTIGSILGMTVSMEEMIEGEVDNLQGRLYFQQLESGYPPSQSIMNTTMAEQALSRDDVDRDQSTAILFIPKIPSNDHLGSSTVLVVGLEPGKEHLFIGNAKAYSGTTSLLSQPQNAVVLGTGARDYYDAKIGEKFEVMGMGFLCIGLLEENDAANINSAIIMDLEFCQQITSRQELVSAVILTPAEGVSEDTLEEDLESGYLDYEVNSQRDIQGILDERMSAPMIVLSMLNIMIFSVAVVIVMNIMIMAVRERTREFGTLRALGMGRMRIMGMVLMESILISGIGGLLGIAATYPCLFLLYTVTGLNEFTTLPPVVYLQLSGLVLLVGVLASLIPVAIAMRINPREALQYD